MIAAILGSRSWNYGKLSTEVARRADAVVRQGLVAGQVVLVPEDSPLDLLVMQHALARLDVGILPIAPQRLELARETLVPLAGVEWIWQSGEGLVPVPASGDVGIRRGGVHCALVIETSGSSGAPKAVMLTAANVLASSRLAIRHCGMGEGDCWLACLPRSHVGGLMIAYRCALAGASVLLHQGFDAIAVAADLARHRVTHLSLVPPMLARLLAVTAAPPPWLRVVLVGGQALSSALAHRAIAAGWPLYLSYGMTETCSLVAASRRLQVAPEPGLVGPALPGIRLSCGGSAASPEPIEIQGPVVMAGYAGGENQADGGRRQGWFRTSDLGYLNANGDLVVLGRADEILVIGGEAVVPSRVEERLMAAPGVEELVLVGLADEVWGHRLVVAYQGELSPASLEGWCREHLSDRERPRGFRRFSQLPVLVSGKVDRGRVRAILVAEIDREA